MLLFVDETENETFFIVAGILVESRESAMSAYRKFKKRIKEYPIQNADRAKAYTEFKSTLLDKSYQRIKLRMIEEINRLDCCVIYSCFIKKDIIFNQSLKEQVYISLLSRIVMSIDTDISIIFDRFNIPAFEGRIVQTISEHANVQAIMPRDSQLEPGLQFVDNICSILRLRKSSGYSSEWYKMIETKVREV